MYAAVRKISLVLVGYSLACACALADQTSFGIADFIAEARNKKLAKKYIDGAKITEVRRKDMLTEDGLPFGVEYEIDFSVGYPFKYYGEDRDLVVSWPKLYQYDEDSAEGRLRFSSIVVDKEVYTGSGVPYNDTHPKKGSYIIKYYLVPKLIGRNKENNFCVIERAHKYLYPGYKDIPRTSHAEAVKYIAGMCNIQIRNIGRIGFDIQTPYGGGRLYENKEENFNGNACTYFVNFLKSNPPLCD